MRPGRDTMEEERGESPDEVNRAALNLLAIRGGGSSSQPRGSSRPLQQPDPRPDPLHVVQSPARRPARVPAPPARPARIVPPLQLPTNTSAGPVISQIALGSTSHRGREFTQYVQPTNTPGTTINQQLAHGSTFHRGTVIAQGLQSPVAPGSLPHTQPTVDSISQTGRFTTQNTQFTGGPANAIQSQLARGSISHQAAQPAPPSQIQPQFPRRPILHQYAGPATRIQPLPQAPHGLTTNVSTQPAPQNPASSQLGAQQSQAVARPGRPPPSSSYQQNRASSSSSRANNCVDFHFTPSAGEKRNVKFCIETELNYPRADRRRSESEIKEFKESIKNGYNSSNSHWYPRMACDNHSVSKSVNDQWLLNRTTRAGKSPTYLTPRPLNPTSSS